MTKRIVTAVAVLGAASLISGCSIEQPVSGCIVQDSSFALWQAKYTVKEADAAKSCGGLKGEELGVWKYANPGASEADKAAGKAAALAIRPRGAASLTRHTYSYKTGVDAAGKDIMKSVTVDRVPASEFANATSLSTTLPEQPATDGFCAAGGFEKKTVAAAPVVHESTGEQLKPAQTVEYTFSNVEVYSHPQFPGTQLRGTLTYGDGTGCSAEYDVWALWPATPCVPDSTDPVESCGEGSGLNPDFEAVCDASLKRCVPARRPPSLKVTPM